MAALAALMLGCGGGGGGGASTEGSGDGGAASSAGAANPAACVATPAASVALPAALSSVSTSVNGAVAPQVWAVESGASRTYAELPLASDDTMNPMRGYHRWFDREQVPQASPSQVSYTRIAWKDLESAQDVYDFSSVVEKASAARAAGRKFAFRIRMMQGYGDNTLYVPAYLYRNVACAHNCGFWSPSEVASSRTFIPDWNDPWLQARARKLLTELRTALATTGVEIAWIDIGLFGQYGEWYLDSRLYSAATSTGGVTLISESSKQAFARMHMEVFPNEQLVAFALWAQRGMLGWALTQTLNSRPLGLRVDCLGRDWVLGEWDKNPSDFALIRDQWKKAPFVAELCSPDKDKNVVDLAMARDQIARFHISTVGNGNFGNSVSDINQRWGVMTPAEQASLRMMGRESGYRYVVNDSSVSADGAGGLRIRATVRNAGNAPSYENWQVAAELVDGTGHVVASQPAGVDLKASLGACSAQSIDMSWAPSVASDGRYTLRLVARHASWPLLRWATEGRDSDGGLTLATVSRSH